MKRTKIYYTVDNYIGIYKLGSDDLIRIWSQKTSEEIPYRTQVKNALRRLGYDIGECIIKELI